MAIYRFTLIGHHSNLSCQGDGNYSIGPFGILVSWQDTTQTAVRKKAIKRTTGA